MTLKKHVLFWSVLYIAVMGAANLIVRLTAQATYGEPAYIVGMLPYLFALSAVGLAAYFLRKEDLRETWTHRASYGLFLVLFVPNAVMALYFIVMHFSLDEGFMIPLVLTLLVGFAEEMMFRRVLFTGLRKEMTLKNTLLLSAVVFSLLHAVNVLAGATVPATLMQLVMTFLAGLFYGLMYWYTKNITLMMVSHWFWDYVLLGGAAAEYSIFGTVMGVLSVGQIVVTAYLLNKLFWKKKSALAEEEAAA